LQSGCELAAVNARLSHGLHALSLQNVSVKIHEN